LCFATSGLPNAWRFAHGPLLVRGIIPDKASTVDVMVHARPFMGSIQRSLFHTGRVMVASIILVAGLPFLPDVI
jgi:hypothetical protein